MNKAELIKRAAKRAGLSQRVVNIAVKAAFAVIKEEGHLEYKSFGVFERVETPNRTWQTPWDGECGVSLGKKKLIFRESKPSRRRKKS